MHVLSSTSSSFLLKSSNPSLSRALPQSRGTRDVWGEGGTLYRRAQSNRPASGGTTVSETRCIIEGLQFRIIHGVGDDASFDEQKEPDASVPSWSPPSTSPPSLSPTSLSLPSLSPSSLADTESAVAVRREAKSRSRGKAAQSTQDCAVERLRLQWYAPERYRRRRNRRRRKRRRAPVGGGGDGRGHSQEPQSRKTLSQEEEEFWGKSGIRRRKKPQSRKTPLQKEAPQSQSQRLWNQGRSCSTTSIGSYPTATPTASCSRSYPTDMPTDTSIGWAWTSYGCHLGRRASL